MSDTSIVFQMLEASERQLKYLPGESLSILDQDLVLPDQPSCMNSQLMNEDSLLVVLQYHYDYALKYQASKVCIYYSAVPSWDTSNVFYEAIL